MGSANTVFTPECQQLIRAAVKDAQGSEVFFQGRYGDALIEEVIVSARGNEGAVAVNMELAPGFNAVIHNHPSGLLSPSDQDIAISSLLMQKGYAFLIVDNNAEQVNVVVEAPERSREVSVPEENVEAVFRQGGSISGVLAGYEAREAQRMMALEVNRAFSDKRHAMIEASTGTGKSLAYLVPLAMWALANRKRGVVCTNTLNLQDQLLYKDVPLVRRIVGDELRVSVVKGRQNYLCLNKINGTDMQDELFFIEGKEEEIKQLKAWAAATQSGIRSELPGIISAEVWEEFASDAETCLGNRCTQAGACFYRKARMEAISAHILIVNYAIFFIDLVLRSRSGGDSSFSLMPAYHRVVFDEAHNMESQASNYFAGKLSNFAMSKRLGRLVRPGRKIAGDLPALVHLLRRQNVLTHVADAIQDKLIPQVQKSRDESDAIFSQLYHSWREGAGYENFSVWINTVHRSAPAFQETLSPLLIELAERCEHLASRLQQHLNSLEDLEDAARDPFEFIIIRLSRAAVFFEESSAFFRAFSGGLNDASVYWVEGRQVRRRPYLQLHETPLYPARMFFELFLKKFSGVVYTSATLSVDGKFAFFQQQNGLDMLEEDQRMQCILPAEFDYQKNALLAVCRSFPQQYDADYAKIFGQFAVRLIELLQGRIFFLFTSWKTMQACYKSVCALLTKEWAGRCLVQGDGIPRNRLLEQFKEFENGVLFGVNSFWEGVDVRGSALSCVVLNKIPFHVPDDPIIAARSARMEEDGISPFYEYSLPQAVIRLKQGFGRLIRTREDYGAVLLLDERLLTKGYGRVFMDSLPPARYHAGTQEEVLEAVSVFFNEHAASGRGGTDHA